MDREQAYESSVKLYQDASPGDLGVPLKLFPQEPGALQGSYPYESAVQELKLLTADSCPQRKLECIGESHVCLYLLEHLLSLWTVRGATKMEGIPNS